MKHIVRIVVSAFALISAAACYNNEIENPDNSQNPEQSGLRITATMAKTRVNYGNETDEQLLPVWQEGDILFGFYGEDPDDNGIVLKVCDVDEGVAELEIVSGELANQNVETSVCLIYTGCNVEDLEGSIDPDDFKFDAEGKFDVDLTSQNLDRIPVCMSASAEIEDGSDGEKTLSFGFTYDCAVLEVETLAGFYETGFEAGSLTGVDVSGTGVSFKGKYSYNEGSFTFIPDDDGSSYSQSLTGWSASSDGNMECSGETKKILISAIPTSEGNISISYNRDGTPICSETFSNRKLEEGNCYVIRHNYVAKTSDNYFFETVAAAFDHAKELSSTYSSGNTVTLVKSSIESLGEHPTSGEEQQIEIDIDYNVTLDLNGCTLTLEGVSDFDFDGDDYTRSVDRSESFYVGEDGTFTITDSKTDGKIESYSDYCIISNDGIVNITGGYLIQKEDWDVVDNYGTLNVSGGKLQSMHFVVENEGEAYTYISGGELSTIEYGDKNKNKEEGYIVIDNYGTLEVSGGTLCNVGRTWGEKENDWIGKPVIWNDPGAVLTVKGTAVLSSTHGSVVYNDYNVYDGPGSCTIEGGTLSSVNDNVVDNYGECDIEGGTLYSEKASAVYSEGGTVDITCGVISNNSDIKETIRILDGASCTISGGVIFSLSSSTIFCGSDDDEDYSTLTITWPIINEMPNPDYGKSIHQPLIYSKSGNSYNIAPVTAFYSTEYDKEHDEFVDHDNTAQVLIQGGYLFTHNNEGIIYLDDDVDEEAFTNLQFSSCGNFYANAYVIDIYGNSENENYFKDLYPSYTYGTITLSATSQTDVYSPNFVSGLPTETSLYYIE